MMNFLLGMAFMGAFIAASVLIDEAIEKHKEKKEKNRMAWIEWRSTVHARINLLRDDFTKSAGSHETAIAILTARTDNFLRYMDASIAAHEQAFHAPKSTQGDKKGEKK